MHRIRVETTSDAVLVRAEGELDAFAAEDIGAAFVEACEASAVVTDLTAVSFLDSTALGLIVRGVREIAERGARARVVLPRTTARRIFEITTLDRVLPVSASRGEALAEVGDDPGA
jgi:anti-sigma B factor antagonist